MVAAKSEEPVKIRLTKDLNVLLANAHNAGNEVIIDLNGHTIDGNGYQAFWNEKGSMTISNGWIENCKSDYGGAINNRGRGRIIIGYKKALAYEYTQTILCLHGFSGGL